MGKYTKAIVAALSMAGATAYVALTGGDPESAQAIASEWETVIMGLITTFLVYAAPNSE